MEILPQKNIKNSDLSGSASRLSDKSVVPISMREKNNALFGKVSNALPVLSNAGYKYSALIIHSDGANAKVLAQNMKCYFPEINVLSVASKHDEVYTLLGHHKVDLIFSEASAIKELKLVLGKSLPGFVLLSECMADAKNALRNNMCGFISIPFNQEDVSISVRCALDKIEKRRNQRREQVFSNLPHQRLVGVPTMEGIEFLDTEKIIRCEGLQKCTLIVTTEKSDIISSYNLGKFMNLLDGQGFFSCHRSHHINLKFVKKYSREGYIFFNADSKPVPLARRRKCAFLDQIRHL